MLASWAVLADGGMHIRAQHAGCWSDVAPWRLGGKPSTGDAKHAAFADYMTVAQVGVSQLNTSQRQRGMDGQRCVDKCGAVR